MSDDVTVHHGDALEGRARRRIRLAVESRGYKLASLEWEPWRAAGEKEGIGGGWRGRTDRPYLTDTHPGDEILGLSVEEALAWVDEFINPPEPCSCDRDHSPLVPIVGSPRTSLHDPQCRWHIRYRLPWWKDGE